MNTSLKFLCVLLRVGCSSRAPEGDEQAPADAPPGTWMFTIPTGAMAETLLGNHRQIRCSHCGNTYRFNASDEVRGLRPAHESICENCRHTVFTPVRDPVIGGDRIMTDLSVPLAALERFDVIVFIYPREPEKNLRYVKRLVGLPDETIAIWGGDVYAATGIPHEGAQNEPQAIAAFTSSIIEQLPAEQGKSFGILRKSPDQILALRTLVHDNQFQRKQDPPRWQAAPEGAWKVDEARQPRRFELRGQGTAALTYRHLVGTDGQPALINDFCSYNSTRGLQSLNWVCDLMLECRATLAPDTLLGLELASGADRFRAEIDVANNRVRLLRLAEKEVKELGSKKVAFDIGEEPRLRFANVDQRLILWLGDELPFGDGIAYQPTKGRGPRAGDLEPCRIEARGDGTIVRDLKIWRDVYYTTARIGSPGFSDAEGNWEESSPAWSDPADWGPLRRLPVATHAVKPEHYLVLGDNSRESSDGRDWGLLPAKHYLGKVTRRYLPPERAGPVH